MLLISTNHPILEKIILSTNSQSEGKTEVSRQKLGLIEDRSFREKKGDGDHVVRPQNIERVKELGLSGVPKYTCHTNVNTITALM